MTDAPQPRPWWRTPWWRGTRERRALLVAEIVLIGLVGAWLGLLAGGNLDAAVGPLQTKLSVAPTLSGGTHVEIPPLGELRVKSHAGPWQLTAEVTRIDAADARRIFSNPTAVNGLGEKVVGDLRGAVITVVLKASLAAVLGGLLLGVLVFRRRWRLVLLSGAVSASVVLAGAGVAAATWDPKSINQPEYDGLLASAPGVVGDVRSIVANFGRYEDQLARLVTNVSRLYDVTSTLPAYQPDPSTLRVLFVSDLHLNPAAWDVIRSITKQFDVEVIVDAGDISDHGSAPENAYVEQIATLGVPYVWVRGNHDSDVTQAAVAAQHERGRAGRHRPGRGRRAAVPRHRRPAVHAGQGDPRGGRAGERVAGGAGDGVRACGRPQPRVRRSTWPSCTTGRRPTRWTGRCRWCCPGTTTGGSSTCCPRGRCRSSRARPGRPGCAGWRGRRWRSRRRCGPRCCTSTARPGPCRRGTTSRWAGWGWSRPRSSGGSWGSSSPSWRRPSRRVRRRPGPVRVIGQPDRVQPVALICGLLWQRAGASPMLSRVPDGIRTPWASALIV